MYWHWEGQINLNEKNINVEKTALCLKSNTIFEWKREKNKRKSEIYFKKSKKPISEKKIEK